MTRVLLLTHRLPFPPNKGDKIRSFHILRHLASRFEVSLGCLIDEPDDSRFVPEVGKLAAKVLAVPINGKLRKLLALRSLALSQPISVLYFHSRELQRQLDELLASMRFDAVVCFSAPMAEYVLRSLRRSDSLKGAARVLDLVDVDSEKWLQYADNRPAWSSWIFRYEGKVLGRYEQRILDEFDTVFLTTPSEVHSLGRSNATHIRVMPNGVDVRYFAPAESTLADNQAPILVFTGAMDYLPNIEGVCWFAQRVFPSVRSRFPDARFVIVGSKPTATVRRLEGMPGITVTGYVDDVRMYLAAASVCVAPLRLGRGVQNKVLEAMAMGKPVVTTSRAFDGIDAQAGVDLLVADGEGPFLEAILALLDNPTSAARMGLNARSCVERGYDWSRNLSLLDAAILQGRV